MRPQAGKSIATRMAMRVIAFVLLLIQALAPLMAKDGVFSPITGVVCSGDASNSDAPLEHHHSGFCCISSCAACGCIDITRACIFVDCAVRSTVSRVWDNCDADLIASLKHCDFAARGPPAIF